MTWMASFRRFGTSSGKDTIRCRSRAVANGRECRVLLRVEPSAILGDRASSGDLGSRIVRPVEEAEMLHSAAEVFGWRRRVECGHGPESLDGELDRV